MGMNMGAGGMGGLVGSGAGSGAGASAGAGAGTGGEGDSDHDNRTRNAKAQKRHREKRKAHVKHVSRGSRVGWFREECVVELMVDVFGFGFGFGVCVGSSRIRSLPSKDKCFSCPAVNPCLISTRAREAHHPPHPLTPFTRVHLLLLQVVGTLAGTTTTPTRTPTRTLIPTREAGRFI